MAAPAGATASAADVARLYGRVAFGATPADLDRWTGRPYPDLVDTLLEVPTAQARAIQSDEPRRLALAASPEIRLAQGWWLERMRTARYPLEERMTLFWHDHFATAVSPDLPDLRMLLAQNQTLRTGALGSVRDLVAAITVDPAMLYWLNGRDSAPPLPNENYAREFFELFTLGRTPQVYTETDVREAARAFTGWTADGLTGQSAFRAGRHDKGTKKILGRTITDLGAAEHVEVARLALDHPLATRFVAAKLVAHLAYVPAETDLLRRPDPLVRAVADELRRSDWQLVPALRVLLLSREFRSAPPTSLQRTVRSPVEVVVATYKALGLPVDRRAADLLVRMGQQLFVPPNVGGWPMGRAWLSPPSVIARYDLGLFAVTQAQQTVARIAPLPPSADLAGWARRLGLPGLSPGTVDALRRYLASGDAGNEADRQAGVAALVLASPDWTVL